MKKNPFNFEPLGLRPELAAAFVGVSTDILERCRRENWIKPAVTGHGLTIYDTSDLRLLWNRLKREGLPKARKAAPETPAQHPASPEGV